MDIATETVFPLAELPNRAPARTSADGKPVRLSLSTVRRWSSKGVRGVVLETCQIGGSRYTSLEAFKRFSERLTAARDSQPASARAPRCVAKQ